MAGLYIISFFVFFKCVDSSNQNFASRRPTFDDQSSSRKIKEEDKGDTSPTGLNLSKEARKKTDRGSQYRNVNPAVKEKRKKGHQNQGRRMESRGGAFHT